MRTGQAIKVDQIIFISLHSSSGLVLSNSAAAMKRAGFDPATVADCIDKHLNTSEPRRVEEAFRLFATLIFPDEDRAVSLANGEMQGRA